MPEILKFYKVDERGFNSGKVAVTVIGMREKI